MRWSCPRRSPDHRRYPSTNAPVDDCIQVNVAPESTYDSLMSAHSHGQTVLDDVIPLNRALRQVIPDVFQGLCRHEAAAMAPGGLDTKTKELIALEISVTLRCDGCIASHARGAAKAGASREEAAEAIGVALILNGGPGTVYGPAAHDAFCEFADTRDG